jgi:hypothetical protein
MVAVAGEAGTAPSWPRAVVATVAVVAAAVGLLVVVPNLIVTRLGVLDRGPRAGVATIWFFAMLAALAWLLRRLQARQLI